ncbi:unnamed protein product [Prorocentrum cordatum]|uniref:Protein Churchill n=1 Tax=Prorocentrum cordatum TaxID=2364126 RepID=A0ABN9QH19_9DINO|nr:unnamed protein product [Polarella glacialis]
MKKTWRTSLIALVSMATPGLASRLARPPLSSLISSMRSAGPPNTSIAKETRTAAADTSTGSKSVQDARLGGTACHCTCGHTVVWQREIFEGDVVSEKEYECEEVLCPAVSIPGLVASAECSYVEDVRELTGGTVCRCLCGDQVAWRDRAFYGDVVESREQQCLEEVCPVANPVPGLRFEAHCRFVPTLFQVRGVRPVAAPAARGGRGSAPPKRGGAVLLPALALAAALAAAPSA